MQDIFIYLPEDKRYFKAALALGILISYLLLVSIANATASAMIEVSSVILLAKDPIKLLLEQLISHLVLFISVSLLVTYLVLKYDVLLFFKKLDFENMGIVFGITFSFMIVNSLVGEWNMNLDFGASGWAQWMRKSEDQLKLLTEHITQFESPIHFLIALVVVAVIPALGEELLFRGLIQNCMIRIIKNHHVAIWLTGFIFAAIHLQFFGLAPRMLLGVLFGYLYYWSGNLSVPVLAHFINNGFALTALYIIQQDSVDVSREQMETSAAWWLILLCACAGTYLLVYFYKKQQTYA